MITTQQREVFSIHLRTTKEIERTVRLIDETHKRGQQAVKDNNLHKAELCCQRAKKLSRKLAELRTGDLFAPRT